MNNEFNELELGLIPDKFNFSIQVKEQIDMNKIQYNSLYKNPLFYLNRMPNPEAFINLPFGSGIQILNEMAENSISPLEELNNLQSTVLLVLQSEIEPKGGVELEQ